MVLRQRHHLKSRSRVRENAAAARRVHCNIVSSLHRNRNCAMQHGTDSCSRKRSPTMSFFSQSSKLALAGAAAALLAASTPVSAEEPRQHLGPVGPSEPILATFGNKRLIAFYVPDSGRCSINAIVFDAA